MIDFVIVSIAAAILVWLAWGLLNLDIVEEIGGE